LLYREGTWDDWHLINGDSLAIFAPNDKKGQIIVDTLKKGEYVLGYYDHTVSTTAVSSATKYSFSVQPNPSSTVFSFYFDLKKSNKAMLRIYDARGASVMDTLLNPTQQSFQWNASNFAKGTYFVKLVIDNKNAGVQKLVLTK